uniref:Pentacotripeptide-repeat region of PRORP domain-containing protein n=1 Tax=Fagus sylvatica TaxID=28930 RepID=A0A2N9EWW0_FAGSY
MALSSISKLFSLSNSLKATPKLSTLNSPTATASASSAEQFYTHLQRHGVNNIEKTLPSVQAPLDFKCVTEVLHRCQPNQSQIGLRFFIWAGLQSNYRHSSFMYSKACELLQINRNPGVVVDIVEGYKVDGCVVSAKAFKGDMDMAEELMNEMGLSDLYPDMITYVTMIKGFCNVGRLEDACGLVKFMRGHGCMPNVVVYSTLLDRVCKCGSMGRALELLGEMEKEGGDCSPNVVTYTSVIQSFCKKGQTMEALEILDRMEAFGCAPNRVTVSSLINGLCMEGCVEKAYKVIDKVVAGDSVSYGDCYSSLILYLVKFKKLEDAQKLFREMLASGVKPDSLASSILIRELCLEGQVLDGFCLSDEIEKLEFLTSIDSDLYSILLDGLCQQSHLVEAAKLARLMLKKGIRLKASYSDSIVEHLKKFEDEELLKHLSKIGK